MKPADAAPAIPALAFAALILATVLAVFDLNMVNLALPVVAADLQIPVASALWLSKTSLLSCALCILPCAALGDVIGHRRLLCGGLLVVLLTTLGCAVAGELALLIGLRGLQGAGSAAIMCSTLVLMRVICPVGALGKAMGLNALAVAVASTAGPALSGVLLEVLGWRWLFGATLPVALIALGLARVTLPGPTQVSSPGPAHGTPALAGVAQGTMAVQGAQAQRPGFDVPSALWLLLMLALLLGASDAGRFAAPCALAAGLVALAFVHRQRRCAAPMLALSIFRIAALDSALLASTLAFVAQSAVFIGVPVWLQGSLGYGPRDAALLFLLWPLTTALTAPFAGRLADRVAAPRLAQVGLLLLACGLLALAAAPATPQSWDLGWRLALCGLGFGLFQSPNNREILTQVPAPHIARGAALLCLARLIGQGLGAVLVGLGLNQTAPQGQGIIELLWGLAALPLLALGVGVWTSRSTSTRWKKPCARPNAP